jgi:hypothetical protein
MKLKDYNGIYFSATLEGHAVDFFYRDTSNAWVRHWETGERKYLDPEQEVEGFELPPRPEPPSASWLDCPATSRKEFREVLRRYTRKVEVYIDAVTNATLAEAEKAANNWNNEAPTLPGQYWYWEELPPSEPRWPPELVRVELSGNNVLVFLKRGNVPFHPPAGAWWISIPTPTPPTP